MGGLVLLAIPSSPEVDHRGSHKWNVPSLHVMASSRGRRSVLPRTMGVVPHGRTALCLSVYLVYLVSSSGLLPYLLNTSSAQRLELLGWSDGWKNCRLVHWTKIYSYFQIVGTSTGLCVCARNHIVSGDIERYMQGPFV